MLRKGNGGAEGGSGVRSMKKAGRSIMLHPAFDVVFMEVYSKQSGLRKTQSLSFPRKRESIANIAE